MRSQDRHERASAILFRNGISIRLRLGWSIGGDRRRERQHGFAPYPRKKREPQAHLPSQRRNLGLKKTNGQRFDPTEPLPTVR